MVYRATIGFVLLALSLGCERPPSSTDIISVLDSGRLNTYRSSLPTEQAVVAPTPMSSMVVTPSTPETMAITPQFAEGGLAPVRDTLTQVVKLVNELLTYAPTLYNTDTEELVWGPFQASTDIGTVALYIRENPEYNPNFLEEEEPLGSPLQYIYAILRGGDYSLENLIPIISGGSTPAEDGETQKLGLVVFDYEQERTFVENYGQVTADSGLPAGRFAAFYGEDAITDTAGTPTSNTQSFVLGIFRSYVPKDDTSGSPMDLNYLYGKLTTSLSTISFANYGVVADLDQQEPVALEEIAIKQAFFSYHKDGPAGSGRSEFTAVNSTLSEQQFFGAEECWDQSLARTYFTLALFDGTQMNPLANHGTQLSSCDIAFQAGLDALGLPDLNTADTRLLDQLEIIAAEGIQINDTF